MAYIVPVNTYRRRSLGSRIFSMFIILSLVGLLTGVFLGILMVPLILIIGGISIMMIISLGIVASNSSSNPNIHRTYMRNSNETPRTQQISDQNQSYSRNYESIGKYCSYCGEKTTLDAKFCPKCGSGLN